MVVLTWWGIIYFLFLFSQQLGEELNTAMIPNCVFDVCIYSSIEQRSTIVDLTGRHYVTVHVVVARPTLNDFQLSSYFVPISAVALTTSALDRQRDRSVQRKTRKVCTSR